jgi:hypothetical protein
MGSGIHPKASAGSKTYIKKVIMWPMPKYGNRKYHLWFELGDVKGINYIYKTAESEIGQYSFN